MGVLTGNKSELLNLFITNPEKSFYMREIGRILGKKPGVFQRTLNRMIEEGILKSEFKANARYFWINRQYPLYEEIRNIVYKTVGISKSLQESLATLKNIHFAFIYGSFAKNKTHAASDVDVMLVGKPNESTLIAELDKLENRLQREINYHLYSLEKFKSDVESKNPFLLEVLSGKKIMLAGSLDELRKFYKK